MKKARRSPTLMPDGGTRARSSAAVGKGSDDADEGCNCDCEEEGGGGGACEGAVAGKKGRASW